MQLSKNSLFSYATKYLVVGICLYVFDFLIFSIFILVDPDLYLWGNIVSRLSGAFVGFLAHRTWTFKGSHKHNPKVQLALYVILLIVNIFTSSVLLYLIINQWHFEEISARLITDVIIITFTFFISKIIVFSHK